MAATPVRSNQWSQEAFTIARQARSLNFLKIEPLIQKLQQTSGRSRRDCVVLIHRCTQQKPMRRSWTEEEIDQVRELLVANSVEEVAKKIGRSPSSVKHLCSRLSIRIREHRCAAVARHLWEFHDARHEHTVFAIAPSSAPQPFNRAL